MPNSKILLTYRLATFFKVIGVATAIITGYITIWDFISPFLRWWSAGLSGLILLAVLAPWWQLVSEANQPRVAHRMLILGLGLGLIGPNLELLHSVYQPYQDLFAYPQFIEILKFTPDQVNNIHGFGQMFIVVPVILATWQYRFNGMLSSLIVAAVGFVGVAFLMPLDAFNWYFYAIRGFVLLGVCLIVGLVTWMLADGMRQEQAKLAEANTKLAEQALIMEELAASRERNRLARELHDTMAHSISGATVQLQGVQTLLSVDVEAAKTELKDARNQLKIGLAESRRSIETLRATPLEQHGLKVALEKEANTLGQRTGLAVQIALNLPVQLSQVQEQAIYRIVTAALNNIERHAEATTVQVHLEKANGRICFVVTDDGKGFDPENNAAEGRFGLIGMQERAELINADIVIDSQPGVGTTIKLCV